MNPSEKPQKFQFVLGKIIKSIGIILASAAGLVIAFSIWLTLQLNIVRPDCSWKDLMCDMGSIIHGNRYDCILFYRSGSRASDAEMARMGYPTKDHFLCLEQKYHLEHQRCYLPHFINNQYEKYQAKQRGEEFYGDVKDCRDIEIQGDGEKK